MTEEVRNEDKKEKLDDEEYESDNRKHNEQNDYSG